MADESRRLIKGMMARFVRLTAIRDAGDDLGKVDCTQRVDDEDTGLPAKVHLQRLSLSLHSSNPAVHSRTAHD